MTEWIASQATGVITHSSWAVDRLLRACPGPVQVAALPYMGSVAPAMAPEPTRHTPSSMSRPQEQGRASKDRFDLLTVGHMNTNKRQGSVIRALGRSALLREKARYCLAGPIEPQYAEQLASLARTLGVQVSIAGEVDDATLAEAIERADVMCCLRSPALESASASAIEALLSGKPTVVTDVGFYSELPDDCVCKVAPEHEIEDLQRILESLYAHPEQRQALGATGAAWATETFSASTYVAHLVHVSELATTAAPAIEAGKYFADVLAQWGASQSLMASPAVTSFLVPLGRQAH